MAGRGTRTIELTPDEVALPGLTDAHLHLAEGGLTRDRVDLTRAPTLVDGLALIAQAHARLPPGAWLQGHGWLPDRWDGWPTADDLSAAAPGRRIALWAHDHHALWVSHAALRAAEVTAGTDDPPGGVVRRMADGSPSGVLHEAAARLVTSRIPPPSADEMASGIASLARELVSLGIVAIHDPGGLSPQEGLGPAFEAYRRLDERDDLPIRVHACIRPEQLEAAADAGLRSGDPIGPVEGRARMGWLKLFADGTLGSRTAALIAPLVPEPGRLLPPGTERGVWITEPDEMTALAARAAELGITTTIHAIGDRAVRAALDALAPTAGRVRFMPRLEHIQLLDPVDRPRFAQHGIAASVQPVHLRTDAAIARRSWGDRAEACGYPLASLDRSGAVLVFGTDAPVESFDPWPGLELAVTRRSPEWPREIGPFGPQEALSLDRALRAQCVGGPSTAAETDRGRLVPGQRADLVVVPAPVVDDPVEVGGPLGRARPRLVLSDGDVAYEA
jgi:predicted amidohydrolase YtcJ